MHGWVECRASEKRSFALYTVLKGTKSFMLHSLADRISCVTLSLLCQRSRNESRRRIDLIWGKRASYFRREAQMPKKQTAKKKKSSASAREIAYPRVSERPRLRFPRTSGARPGALMKR